ncbi:hypothetical protein TNCV_2541731 [Trichonephila clavipes]|nr:hypothetical protein TNCV_2541731 [Trichonephila clavipes]
MLTKSFEDKTFPRAHVFVKCKISGTLVSVEDDAVSGHPRSAITDQNIGKIRDMWGFPLTSVVRLSGNQHYYTEVLEKLREKIKEKSQNWGLMDGCNTKTNTPAPTALFVKL